MGFPMGLKGSLWGLEYSYRAEGVTVGFPIGLKGSLWGFL